MKYSRPVKTIIERITFPVIFLLLVCLPSWTKVIAGEIGDAVVSESATFKVETVAEGMQIPWALDFLPGGDALVGDVKSGSLHRLNIASGKLEKITGLPTILLNSEISSGLFDVKVHPDYSNNGLVYLAYGVGSAEANGLSVSRFRLMGTHVDAEKLLLNTSPRIKGKWHFGGRLVFSNGYLFVSTGDGYDYPGLAQDLSAHPGKILRIHDDGRIPGDNPFIGDDRALPEIWAYGVRNPQGMAVHPTSKKIWINEHGPQGGDEVNIPAAGKNYGWPVITYGEEYGGGPIGDGITHHQGMLQPVYYWRPSIAPSGMEFYTGTVFPGWKNSVFIGALALKHINRLVIEDERVIHEERLLLDREWRIRFVKQGPDGYLYFGTDEGKIMRLVPVAESRDE